MVGVVGQSNTSASLQTCFAASGTVAGCKSFQSYAVQNTKSSNMLNKFTVGLALVAFAYYFGMKSSNLSGKSEVSEREFISAVVIGWEEQIEQPSRKMKRVAMG